MIYGLDPCCRIRDKLKTVVMYDNLRPVQFLLSLVAAGWAFSLMVEGDTLTRPVYQYLRILGSEKLWTVLWSVLALLLFWRTLEVSASPWLRLAVDSFSLLTFSFISGAILLSRPWPFPAAVVADFVWCLAALWVLARFQFAERDGCE